MIELRTIDGQKIKDEIERAKPDGGAVTQAGVSARCRELHASAPKQYSPVSVRTIQRIIAGQGNVRQSTLDTLLAVLKLTLDEVSLPPERRRREVTGVLPGELERIQSVLKTAIARAMDSAARVLHQPYIVGAVQTSPKKITDRAPEDDPTEPIDEACRQAIFDVLQLAFRDLTGPLGKGFLVVSEERGVVMDFVRRDAPEYILFLDEADDTRQAKRGLGGTSLASVYHRNVGWCVVVAGDFMRRTLYSRVRDQSSRALRLSSLADSDRDLAPTPAVSSTREPQGWPRELRSSGVRSLAEAAVNLNLAKANRLEKTVRLARPVLDELGSNEILSEAGTRGMLLVADGLIDAAVEVAKGYRPLDLIPGAFIAEGVADVRVCDLEGKDLNFGPDAEIEELLDDWLDDDFDPGSLDALRKKFIVAATRALATEVVEALRHVEAVR